MKSWLKTLKTFRPAISAILKSKVDPKDILPELCSVAVEQAGRQFAVKMLQGGGAISRLPNTGSLFCQLRKVL